MNSTSSNETLSFAAGATTAEAISRRAYELWEAEGRPDGNDMRHWLQAEQELGSRPQTATETARYTDAPQARPTASVGRAELTHRASPPTPRETKRASASTVANGSSDGSGRRRA